MARALVSALVFLPTIAGAELFEVASAPDRVTVYPGLAEVSRSVILDMPAGQHDIRLSDLPRDFLNFDVSVSNAVLLSRVLRDPTLTGDLLAGSADVQAARRRLEDAREALARLDDQVAELTARRDSALAQIAYLEGLSALQPESIDAAQLRALGQAIAEDGATARAEILATEIEARGLERDRKDLEDTIRLAEVAFDRLDRPVDDMRELELKVSLTQAGPVEISLSYWVDAEWAPDYRMYFDSETSELTIERDVAIVQNSGEPWDSVALEVTTVPVNENAVPSIVWPRLMRIFEGVSPEALRSKRLEISSFDEASAAVDPIIEAPVISEETAQISFSGAGVSYTFDSPVSIGEDETAFVALAPLSFTPEQSARAAPLFDETAYRMLSFLNDTGERVLRSQALGFVDGVAIGSIDLETIEAGEEVEIGFGAIHGLQLTRAVIDRTEGDRGIIARENQTEEEVRISLENFTDRAWDVTLVDRVPYSEQEDLKITWSATPAPQREDVEDGRGILEWDLTVSAGSKQEIRLNKDIRWPEDMTLR